MTVGGQEFQLDFDTGSSDLFVPGTQCTKDGCVGHKKYSTTKTARKMKGTFKISYGDGSSTSGPIYTESMSIAGLSITNQTFSPTTIMSPTFANTGDGNGYPADGIAGMGFPALSQTRTTPFFRTFIFFACTYMLNRSAD
jgi:cathepsin D